MRFENRVLFATGAASGIGAATARRFTEEGGTVALADLDGERARAAAADLNGAIALACDVADEASVKAAVSDTLDRLGRVDAVLNAAGHVVHGPIEGLTLEDWNRMLAVHATGTFLVCRTVLPALRDAGGGSIVNVASVGALVGRENLAAYAAAKGAILAFSRQLAVETAKHNVRVNVVAPGVARTGMTEAVYLERGGGDFDKGAAGAVAQTLMQRLAAPEEIAAPICFLLSDEASYFTGSLLVPDGGMTAI